MSEIKEKQRYVLEVIERLGRCTDKELIYYYRAFDYPMQSPSGLRTRRHELVDKGLIEDSGKRERDKVTGRRMIVWKVKK